MLLSILTITNSKKKKSLKLSQLLVFVNFGAMQFPHFYCFISSATNQFRILQVKVVAGENSALNIYCKL